MKPTSARVGWRALLIMLVMGAAIGSVLLLPAITQDPAYHALADTRTLLGVRNALNVMTNLAFLVVGLLGIRACMQEACGVHARRSWTALFISVALVSVGSGYYHLAPDNNTLVWDRLPMGMGFMALMTAIAAEYINPRLEKILLVPMLLLGASSVIYWHYSDDLRIYALVQFSPLLAIPLVMLMFRSPYTHDRYLLAGLVTYSLAKVAEHYDWAIYRQTTELISGHSLKHLLAALALYFIYRMLRIRVPARSDDVQV